MYILKKCHPSDSFCTFYSKSVLLVAWQPWFLNCCCFCWIQQCEWFRTTRGCVNNDILILLIGRFLQARNLCQTSQPWIVFTSENGCHPAVFFLPLTACSTALSISQSLAFTDDHLESPATVRLWTHTVIVQD